MIALPAAALSPGEAARRVGRAPSAFWLSAPAADEVGPGRDMVGASPGAVVAAASPATGDPLGELEQAWAEARAAWAASGGGAPPGIPVAVGWISYDLGRSLVGLPVGLSVPGEDATTGWPALEFAFHDAVWVREGPGAATIFARDARAARRLAELLDTPAATTPPTLGPLVPEHADGVYLRGVERVLDYLGAGDTYQVNLARRLSAVCRGGDPVELALALRARAAAPHAAFLAAADGEGFVVGNSPERFLALSPDGAVETRPIKGTRPRGGTPEEDAGARVALAQSDKDAAEHVMIVDLERNDLGRVCVTGSVEVASLRRLVTLPTVHHLVSTVRGRLRPQVGLEALLRATFPGGSITGAPKRRSMQIIDELEPVPRGIYTGATGWLGAAGDLDLAIAIRTALVRGGRLSLSVGGGIVADSNADAELAETVAKARAFASLTSR